MLSRRKKSDGQELVDKHIRTYLSLLSGGGELPLSALEQAHLEMEPNLHPAGESESVDVSALVYASLRLPLEVGQALRVVMGQSDIGFQQAGYEDIAHWTQVFSPARRRHWLFDGKSTLAAYVNSVSDIDDLVPCLTALQLEWNKVHRLLSGSRLGEDLADGVADAVRWAEDLRRILGMSAEDWELLAASWGESLSQRFSQMALAPRNWRVSMPKGRFSEYRRSAQNWWQDLQLAADHLMLPYRPVYFVSSNLHSLANLVNGFVGPRRDEFLSAFVEEEGREAERLVKRLTAQGAEHGLTDLACYAAGRLASRDLATREELSQADRAAGLFHFEDKHNLHLSAQILEMNKLDPSRLDQRLAGKGLAGLAKSRALLLNIEYPLGFAAYHIFSQVLSGVGSLAGAYILGKAAIMNGRLGDIMIPSEVLDLHSGNRFFLPNCFKSRDFGGLLENAAAFEKQKAICVRGTFLQNRNMMRAYHLEDFNGIEMEAGPYLCALYEHLHPERYPLNGSINLHDAGECELGILHYGSDTPYSRRESLLSRALGAAGLEPTYACATVVLRRILGREAEAAGRLA